MGEKYYPYMGYKDIRIDNIPVNLSKPCESTLCVMVTAPTTEFHKKLLGALGNTINDLMDVTFEEVEAINKGRAEDDQAETPKMAMFMIEMDPGGACRKTAVKIIGDVTDAFEEKLPGFVALNWDDYVGKRMKEENDEQT